MEAHCIALAKWVVAVEAHCIALAKWVVAVLTVGVEVAILVAVMGFS